MEMIDKMITNTDQEKNKNKTENNCSQCGKSRDQESKDPCRCKSVITK